MRLSDLSKYEVLLSDERLEPLADRIRSEFGHRLLKDTQFVTFIQPAREVNTQSPAGIAVRTWVPEMAVFAVLTPNPRPYAQATGQKLMTHGTVALEDFREADDTASHYAGAPDEALKIFKAVMRVHLKQLADLKELMN